MFIFKDKIKSVIWWVNLNSVYNINDIWIYYVNGMFMYILLKKVILNIFEILYIMLCNRFFLLWLNKGYWLGEFFVYVLFIFIY